MTYELDDFEKECEAKIVELQQQLQRVEAELLSHRAGKAGVKVGDIVQLKGAKAKMHGQYARVVKIESWGGGLKPFLHGNVRKKNGEFGERVVFLAFDWIDCPQQGI